MWPLLHYQPLGQQQHEAGGEGLRGGADGVPAVVACPVPAPSVPGVLAARVGAGRSSAPAELASMGGALRAASYPHL